MIWLPKIWLFHNLLPYSKFSLIIITFNLPYTYSHQDLLPISLFNKCNTLHNNHYLRICRTYLSGLFCMGSWPSSLLGLLYINTVFLLEPLPVCTLATAGLVIILGGTLPGLVSLAVTWKSQVHQIFIYIHAAVIYGAHCQHDSVINCQSISN